MDRRQLNLVVTGGRRISPEVCDMAYAIGRAVVEKGHIIMTGGASGSDECAARGALEYLRKVGRDPRQQIISFRPKESPSPHFAYGQVLVAGRRHFQRREKLVQAGDIIVLIAGEEGTEHIFDCAIQQRKPVLPVGQTGGMAEEKWKAIQVALDHYYSGKISPLEFQRLYSGEDDPQTIARLIVKLAERLAFREPPGIPPSLYLQLRQALLDCGPLDTDSRLRAVFTDERLNPWRDSVPQGNNPVERAEAVIDFMHTRRRSDSGQNALVLLLQVLSQRINPADACHKRLAELADELQLAWGSNAEFPTESESPNGQPPFASESAMPQPGDLRLLVFDDHVNQWASQCEFSIPSSTPGRKLAYSLGFPLLLANRGAATIRDLVIEMQLASDTDFFLTYEYGEPPLVIEDSPRDWRISKRYDFCEFEGGADFTCHAKGRRRLGTVRMLVPHGQSDTTLTFHYHIQSEGYDDQGSFKVILKQDAEQEL